MRLSYKEKPYIMQHAKEKCARSDILLRCSINNISSKKNYLHCTNLNVNQKNKFENYNSNTSK